MKKTIITIAVSLLLQVVSYSQQPLITNINARNVTSLNGQWEYIVDPYETGFYDYRWKERNENDKEAYWSSDVPENKMDRKEHGYVTKYTLRVPGDWNSQAAKFLYYEGTVWYKRSFNYKKKNPSDKVYLYFGAVNYKADVYLNGKKLGSHKGGFTPFDFEIPDSVLREKNNFLVVKVDNKRFKDEVPTLNTDWWNYGGITRDVLLAEVPQHFIVDYLFQLKINSTNEVGGWIKFNSPVTEKVILEIPELKWKKEITADADSISFNEVLSGLQLWSPENPKLYTVKIHTPETTITDKIGFRTIEVQGKHILLNGKPVFLRGISVHEEISAEARRAYNRKDALSLLGEVKELNGNMVRLAHYPHDENITRVADSLGILVWSEIPVYWTIDFANPEVLEKAKEQLNEMITRDRNRACIIIWSVGNETPVYPVRTTFIRELITKAHQLDDSRLVSAALEIHTENGVTIVDDPLGAYSDILSFNEYMGWYVGLPSGLKDAKWEIKYDKPFFISETGAGALQGFHADSLTMWTEEFQAWFYSEQIAMLKKMPAGFSGISPWILNDFRSPRRNNPTYQDGWNRKGLVGSNGKKKKAFYVLKKYYDEKKLKPF